MNNKESKQAQTAQENKQDAKNYFQKYNGKLPFWNRELSLYVSNSIRQNGKFVLPPAVTDARSMEELLSPVIGMDTIKSSLYRLRDYVTFQKKASENEKERSGAVYASFRKLERRQQRAQPWARRTWAWQPASSRTRTRTSER